MFDFFPIPVGHSDYTLSTCALPLNVAKASQHVEPRSSKAAASDEDGIC